MKVFVLGLDGATFNCLNPLMEEGIIPNIKEMCAKWSYGRLTTIFPPVTAPAWLALATGLNPGKTGVFDYINKISDKSDDMLPISSSYYEGRSIWNFLNNENYKVGIFNYPTLSPPPSVDGFSISGMGGYRRENLSYPQNIESELNDLTNGFETGLNLRNPKYSRDINLFFKDINRIISKQYTAMKFLILEKKWDFFFGVFSFTDWIQHVIWKYIDKTHPLHDPGDSAKVLEKYKATWNKIDSIIGELIELLPKETLFMIVSDHGAGPIDSVFYPNTWLEGKGWLEKKSVGWRSLASENIKLFSSGSDNKYANKIIQFLKTRVLRITSSMDLIDMENSLAFSPEHNTMFGCINLTEKGKLKSGFKEKIINEIKHLPETIDGIDKVQIIFPEQIYSGPYTNLSPDIFFIINDYHSTVEVDLTKKSFVSSPSISMRTGGHLPDGVFIVKGDLFNNVELKGISVLDIAPTILALYGIKIPFEMDGKVITDCIRPEMINAMNIRKSKEGLHEERETPKTGDLEEMKRTLKSLGYM